jgi:uncharacterized protein
MVIDIDRVPRDGLTVSRSFEFTSLELVDEDAVFLEPVHAEMTVRRVNDEVWIKGRVHTRMSFVCSRCLAPFEFPVDSRFDLVFLPEDEREDVRQLKDELDDEDADTLFYSGRQIDLREVALEQLNLPDQAAMRRVLRGHLRRVRQGPQERRVRLPDQGDRRPPGKAQNSNERQEIGPCPTPNADIPIPARDAAAPMTA